MVTCSFPPSPFNRRLPCLGTTGAELGAIRSWNRLEVRRFDLLHVPSLVEGVPDLLLGNPPRSFGAWLLVGKAEDVQQSTRPKEFCKAPHEYRSFLIGKGVEQPAVDHGVELPAELA